MNVSQKLGLFVLILISVVYVYISFFSNGDFDINLPKRELPTLSDDVPNIPEVETPDEQKETEDKPHSYKTVKIYVADSNGKVRSVNRKCDTAVEKSCFEYAFRELLSAPSKWEKSKGFVSEIPVGTKIRSIRESDKNIMVDLSSAFESGGGAESTYIRVKQVIKTAKANTNLPVYLYINGKQADVIGGEGIMIKQPLSERSLDE